MLMRAFALLSGLLLLNACATMVPRKFSDENELMSSRGAPTKIWDNPDGSRTLEYATQPNGETCWMYTVESDGVIVGQYDALEASNLARVKTGMSTEEVRRMLGQQRSIQHFVSSGEDVWDWNIPNEWPDLLATRFNVHFIDSKVVRTSQSYEYPQLGWGFGSHRYPHYGGGAWGGHGWGRGNPFYW